MSDPERIWLQNADDARATGDRLWCQDKVWPECDEQQEPTEYIRADLYASRISQQDTELERLRRELSEAQAKLFPYADATEISGISFDGKYLIGDKKSISYFHEMKNRGEQIDVYARAYEQRIAAAEAKLAEARRAAFIEAAEIAEDRMPVVQCMSVEPIVSACLDIAAALRSKAEESQA